MDFIKPDWKIEAERRGESLPDWYSLIEASKVLGVSQAYLSKIAIQGKIPTVKVGAVRFMKEEQIQYLMDKK